MNVAVDRLQVRLPGVTAMRARAVVEAALERAAAELEGIASRRSLGAVELRIRVDDETDDEALIDALGSRLVEALR